jgi:hypothetical protein
VEYLLNALQWPAMVVTLTAAWLVASQSTRKRTLGFWCFVANLRGVRKNDPQMQATAQR